jgi:integrase
MINSSKIRIPKSSQTKNLYVFCNNCKYKSKTVLSKTPKCTHPTDKIVFKAIITIPGTTSVRTKILKAKNLDDAIIEKIQFEKELKQNNYAKPTPKAAARFKKQTSLLLLCIAEYLSYLDNINVYEHQKKNLSKDYKNQISRYLMRFVDSLNAKKIPIKHLRINDVNDLHVSAFHEYLENRDNCGNRTFNRHMDTVSEFFNYYINIKGYQLRNYFSSKNVRRNPVVTQNETISQKDFKRLLSVLTEENGMQVLATGENKYHFHEWLEAAFELALLTGRRRDELMLMKFSDVKEQDRKLIYIRMEDYKYNRRYNLVEENEKKYLYSPIIYELGLVLQRLGYNKHKNTDRYIIAGDSERKRDTLKEDMSKAFTHYYKLLGNEKELSFKHLRKTYITLLNNFTNGGAEAITGHSGQGIIMKSYQDQKVFNDTLKDFRMIS